MNVNRITKQIATYWPIDTVNPDGTRTHGNPVEIKCRWEDTVEEFLDGKGERTLSQSKIFFNPDKVLADHGFKIEIGGLFLEAELTDVPFPEEPWNDENGQVREVRQLQKIPDRKAKKRLGIAWV